MICCNSILFASSTVLRNDERGSERCDAALRRSRCDTNPVIFYATRGKQQQIVRFAICGRILAICVGRMIEHGMKRRAAVGDERKKRYSGRENRWLHNLFSPRSRKATCETRRRMRLRVDLVAMEGDAVFSRKQQRKGYSCPPRSENTLLLSLFLHSNDKLFHASSRLPAGPPPRPSLQYPSNSHTWSSPSFSSSPPRASRSPPRSRPRSSPTLPARARPPSRALSESAKSSSRPEKSKSTVDAPPYVSRYPPLLFALSGTPRRAPQPRRSRFDAPLCVPGEQC